jgi:hypothetical protein
MQSHEMPRDSRSIGRSVHGFEDELLLALERSGKTLDEIQIIIIPWKEVKNDDPIMVDGLEASFTYF